MSAPVSSFSKLSISPNMQSSQGPSRSRADIKGKGKAIDTEDDPIESESDQEDQEDQEDEEDEEDEEGNPNTWDGRLFALEHCRQTDTDYAFQMVYAEVKYCGVRLSTTDSSGPRCSCDEEGCGHIEWLLEQLSRTHHGQLVPFLTPSQSITAAGGLQNVCDELHWELRDDNSGYVETDWRLEKSKALTRRGRQTRGAIRRRMQTVRDIMATLSHTTSENYKPEIFEMPDQIKMECVPGNLEATVAGILILDDEVFEKFNNLVSLDTRACEYFRKTCDEREEILRLFDEYCEVGPTIGWSEQYDVGTCAQKLVNIVDAIKHNVRERSPLSPLARREAAKSLVELLTTVVLNRNVDAYQNCKWPRKPKYAESHADRNLYCRLIGSGPRSITGQYFILTALQDLPEAQLFLVQLEVVLSRLDMPAWKPTPRAYRDKLSDIITELKRGRVSPIIPPSSAGKRAAGAMDRKAKRMK